MISVHRYFLILQMLLQSYSVMHITARKAILILLTLAVGLMPVRYVLAAFTQSHMDHKANVTVDPMLIVDHGHHMEDATSKSSLEVTQPMHDERNHCQGEYKSCCLHCGIGLTESPLSSPVYQAILNSRPIRYICKWVSYPSFKPPRKLHS